MFFVGNLYNDKIGVVDTDDCTIEYWSYKDLNNVDVDIVGYSRDINSAMLQNTNELLDEGKRYSLSRKYGYKLYNTCVRKSDDIYSYLMSNYIFGIHDFLYSRTLYFTSDIKLFDYSETNGFYIIVLEVRMPNGKSTIMIIKVNSGGYIVTRLLGLNPDKRYDWKFDKEPSGSGYLYNMRISKETGKNNILNNQRIYLKIYYNNKDYILFSIYDFSIEYISR